MTIRTVELTRRIQPWQADHTTCLAKPDPQTLPNWPAIHRLLEELAYETLAGLEEHARQTGADLVIATANASIDVATHSTTELLKPQPKPKRKRR